MWLVHSGEHVALNLNVVGLSPTLGVEITKSKLYEISYIKYFGGNCNILKIISVIP